MATPDVVQFVPLNQQPEEILEALGVVAGSLDTELAAIGRLGYGTEDGRFGFEGYEEPCTSFSDAAHQVAAWGDIALQFLLPPGGGICFAYLWRARDMTCFSLELQAGNLYFENEDWAMLEWVRRFLLDVTSTLATVGSAYDAFRDEIFQPLNISEIMSKLRAGTLVQTVPLSHYMIRHDAIDQQEIRALAERYADTGFQYFETTTGYYVLDNLF